MAAGRTAKALEAHWRTVRAVAIVAAAAALVLSAWPAESVGYGTRAWSLTIGFALLAAVALKPRRGLAPFGFAAIFAVMGGLSAVVAVPDPQASVEIAKHLSTAQKEASHAAVGFGAPGINSWIYAAFVTALAGVTAIVVAALVQKFAGRPSPKRSQPDPARVERLGKIFVALAFAGVFCALIRFAATQLPIHDAQNAVKSFWEGGSYFLLVATFAIPGFGLWFHALLAQAAPRREYLRLGFAVAVYLALLVPTGQRGFGLALGLMALVVLAYERRLSLRQFLLAVLAGIAILGITQAARNEIREESTLNPGNLISRLTPDKWNVIYGSQLASFEWTVEVAAYRDQLHLPNSYPLALLKPIPRQLYPGKSQGFGQEFTARVYPSADKQHVSFSIPLTAETDYDFGPAGVVIVFAILATLAALGELFVAGGAPRPVRAVVMASIAWTAFVLSRGDLANALVFSSGWLIPLAVASRGLGLREPRRGPRILIDALQVSPEFSGIGRRVAEIGQSLGAAELEVPLEVRCAEDVAEMIEREFPSGTRIRTPLRSSRPRLVRIFFQQLIAPFADRRSTLLVCPGDQVPVWGRASLVLVLHDVRRLTHPDTSGGRLEALYYRVLLRRGARRAKTILTVSEFSQREIERVLAPKGQVIAVACHPQPVPLATSPPSPSPTFLAVGAVRSYKGLGSVIEALAEVNGDAAPQVVCVGGSEGHDTRVGLAREAERLGVADRFQMTGWVDDGELERLYASCAGTVNASTYEGYGMPVAESLARGLPTIASDIPPHREIAADAALYFEPGDAAGLAQALRSVATDGELRRRLAEQARARSQELARSGSGWGELIASAAREALRRPSAVGDATAAARR
jgi:glycosyltransferase involved in cell wall biosynthesis